SSSTCSPAVGRSASRRCRGGRRRRRSSTPVKWPSMPSRPIWPAPLWRAGRPCAATCSASCPPRATTTWRSPTLRTTSTGGWTCWRSRSLASWSSKPPGSWTSVAVGKFSDRSATAVRLSRWLGPPADRRESPLAIALIPGSFDPVTNGHLDIMERTARYFDEVIVAVIRNPQKSEALFMLEEREDMIRDVTTHLPNVRVDFFKGLLVDFARKNGVGAIVKGLRAVSDFDYELQMAQMNVALSGIDTLFIPTAPQHSFLSSSLVREVARFGGDVTSMVPPQVAQRLKERFAK